jgi:hypothetical protein
LFESRGLIGTGTTVANETYDVAAMTASYFPPRLAPTGRASSRRHGTTDTVLIWDAHLPTMAAEHLLAQGCARLAGLTKLTRDEMRLASYPDSIPETDVCIDTEKVP